MKELKYKFVIILAFVCGSLLLFSCSEKTKVEQAVEEQPVALQLVRFDKQFFETPVAKLPELKKAFPDFFPADVPDEEWIEKMTNPLWRELYGEVQKAFPDFKEELQEIKDVKARINYYFPEERSKNPEVITMIYEMDPSTKVLYTDKVIIISLEMYLGRNHKFYEFPEYQRANFEKSQLMPDLVSAFAATKIPFDKEKTFLSKMITAGKELYLKDLLLPETADSTKIGYTDLQLKFCQENEAYIWKFFIEEKLLYDTDPKLAPRFINPAPFSKFYLEIDNETPGRIGTWVGWQIVRAYAEKNKVPIQKLLLMDADTIFRESKYKPKQDE